MYFEISSSLLKATKKELEAVDNSKSIEGLLYDISRKIPSFIKNYIISRA